MVILDASALLSLLFGEPAEDEVAALLRERPCGLPATGIAEIIDRSVRLRGVPAEVVESQITSLAGESVEVLAIETPTAVRAGRIRALHYERNRAALSLADCLVVAVAGERDSIATSDGPLAEAARAEGLGVVALRDSRGKRSPGP